MHAIPRFLIAASLVAGFIVGIAATDLRKIRADDHAPAQHLDRDGDVLPVGAMARLGSKRLRPDRDPVAITFLSDNKTIVLVSRTGWVQDWDAASGRMLREKRFSEREISNEAAALGGRLIPVSGFYIDEDRKAPVEWIGLVSQLGTLALRMDTADRGIRHMAISPEGHTLAYGGINGVHLIDVENQKEIVTRQFGGPREVDYLAFSPDSKRLAVGTRGNLYLWDWAESGDPSTISLPVDPRYGSAGADVIAFSPDGTTLAVATRYADGLLLFDISTGRLLRSFPMPGPGEMSFIKTAAFSPDGKLIAVPIESRKTGVSVLLFEVATGTIARHLQGQVDNAGGLAFSADGRYLAAISTFERTMGVWDVQSGKAIDADFAGHSKPPTALRFLNGDLELVSAGDDGAIRVWNLADSSQLRAMRHAPGDTNSKTNPDPWIRTMDVSPDGKFIVSSSLDDTVRLWEIVSGREIYRLPGHGILGGCRAVQFTPDSKQFASWGDDMRVYLWDVVTGKALQDYRAQPAGVKLPDEEEVGREMGFAAGGRLNFGLFSPDASTLLLGMGNIRRFSVATGKELPAIDVNTNIGLGLAVSPDNKVLVITQWGRGTPIALQGGGQSQTRPQSHPVKFWSLAANKPAAEFEMTGQIAGPSAFSPDGHCVALTGGENEQYHAEIRVIPDLSQIASIDLPSRPARSSSRIPESF